MTPLACLLCFPASPSLHTLLFLALHSSMLVHLILTLQIPFPAMSGKVCPSSLKHHFPITPTMCPSPSSTQDQVLIFPLFPPACSNLRPTLAPSGPQGPRHEKGTNMLTPMLPREAWEVGRGRSDREAKAQGEHMTRHWETEGTRTQMTRSPCSACSCSWA